MPNQTGPTGKDGKLVSRMNNFKHGGCADVLFLTSDNPAEFFALLENAFEQHKPAFDQDADLVTDSVRARWIVNRRQRAADQGEGMILNTLNLTHNRDYHIAPTDLHQLDLYDRYLPRAERALNRALKNLQLIKKMANDDQRWQQQLIAQKQKLAHEVEKLELAKQREARLAAKKKKEEKKEETKEETKEPTIPFAELISAGVMPNPPKFKQTLFIGPSKGVTRIFEVNPSNEAIRRELRDNDQVLRIYNFVGAVPDEYKHLLTPDAISWGKSTSVQHLYDYDDYIVLTNKE